MKAFAEAPCKAIITGEHFVVHGAWALAAAVERRVRVEACEAEELVIESDGHRSSDSSKKRLAPVAKVVTKISEELRFNPRVLIRIASQVPESSGLGSSAATMVAVALALTKLKGMDLGTSETSRYAMAGETAIHGRPSGIDINICATGGVIMDRMGEEAKKVRFAGSRRFLIVQSGTKRSTRTLIDRVSRMKLKYPGLFAGLANSASLISELAATRLVNGDMQELGRLLTYSHAVLSTVGASTPKLDRLVDLLLALGCYGAKLTGAGGGGSVFAIPREGSTDALIAELKSRGYESFQTNVPCEGVKSWLQ